MVLVDMGDRLTRSEIEMLEMIARGSKNKDVAKATRYSIHTVSNKLRVIYQKLHARTRVQAVIFALRKGLISVKEVG